MSEPPKSRFKQEVSHLLEVGVANARTVFLLVLPYIMVDVWRGNFLTKRDCLLPLRLTGICRAFRYWNLLRRQVNLLLLSTQPFPVSFYPWLVVLIERLPGHGFARAVRLSQQASNMHPTLSTCRQLARWQADQPSVVDWTAPGLWIVGGFRFPRAIRNIHPHGQESLVCLCHSFAEACLFTHAVMLDTRPDNQKFDRYVIVCDWTDETIEINAADRRKFMKSRALGRLKRVGVFDQQEWGFCHGILKHSAYSWFLEICDTSAHRKKGSPRERLATFISTWFYQSPAPNLSNRSVEVPNEMKIHFEV